MDLTNRKLGKYEIIERLGQGGMAEVYKAFQPGVERFVAIKVMHSHLADSEDFIQRFQREARSIGQLQHTNIARVIDFDAESNLYYMVMDYIQGGTLADYLKAEGPLPAQRALEIVAPLTDGLDYAHQQKMIHRDIKPDNVMFSDPERQTPIITDFGIARLMDDSVALTVAGAMVGTPAYMSPEAARGEECDERTDIYSLGVVLYEMVTGKTPYTADTPYGVIMKQANEPLPPPKEVQPNLPESVNTLLLKALDKEPDTRYQSAAEFGDDVRVALAELGGAATATPARRGTTATRAAAKANSRSTESGKSKLPLILAGAGVLLVALFTYILITMLGDGGGPAQNSVESQSTAESEIAANDITADEADGEEPNEEAAIASDAATSLEEELAEDTDTENAQLVATPEDATDENIAEEGEIESTEDAVSPEIASEETVTQPAMPALHEIGILTFTDNARSPAGDYHLSLSQVPEPPQDSLYELWLTSAENEPLNLGELTVEQGRIDLHGSTDQNLLANYDQAEIRIVNSEMDESQILFVSQPPAQWLTALRPLLSGVQERESGLLADATEQLQLALQHTGFVQEALVKNNLDGVRQHAEHVINILDGDAGVHKDDMDGDGMAQNPGDGVGVHNYLETIHDELAQALSLATASLATDDAESVPAPLRSLQRCLALTTEAIEQGTKIFASDTVEEAQPFVDETRLLLETVLRGDESATGLLQAQTSLQGLAAFRFLAGDVADEMTPEMMSDMMLAHYQTPPSQSRLGRIRFVDDFFPLGEDEQQADYGQFGLQQDGDDGSDDSSSSSSNYDYGSGSYGSDGYGGGYDYGGNSASENSDSGDSVGDTDGGYDYGSGGGYDYGASSTASQESDKGNDADSDVDNENDQNSVVPPVKMGRNRAAKLQIELNNLPMLGPNEHYALWLIDDRGEAESLGQLPVENGKVSTAIEAESNLLALYNGVQVTVEIEDGETLVKPSDQLFFSTSHPAEYLAPLRQLLAESALEEEQGLIASAEAQLAIARDHNQFVIDALQQDSLGEALRHTEHVVNTLEGKAGAHFGDMDRDGMAQNPGDGVGVRAYLEAISLQLTALDEALADANTDTQFYYERASSAHENSLQWLTEATEEAMRLFAIDTSTEAQPVIEELSTLLDTLQNGSDLDGNGIIEPSKHEGGVNALYNYSLLLAEFVIE